MAIYPSFFTSSQQMRLVRSCISERKQEKNSIQAIRRFEFLISNTIWLMEIRDSEKNNNNKGRKQEEVAVILKIQQNRLMNYRKAIKKKKKQFLLESRGSPFHCSWRFSSCL